MNALEETKIKLLAVDCLKALKERKTFRALSKELNLPAGVLNRYINGYVLPKLDRSEGIISNFLKLNFDKLVMDSAKREGSKYMVTSDILSQPFLLNIIAYRVQKEFGSVDKILTAAVDGVPLAYAIASFMSARSVYAKQTQEMAFSDYFVSKSTSDQPLSSPFFLPKNLLRRNESVIIVDDVIRAGRTFSSLISIASQAKVEIKGIFAIFITRTAYNMIRKQYKVSAVHILD